MIGDTLRMVAGRHRDDPGAALGLGEAQELVQRAALLEGAGRVQRLELEKNLAPGHLGQCRGADRRGVRHCARDRRLGAADVGDRDG